MNIFHRTTIKVYWPGISFLFVLLLQAGASSAMAAEQAAAGKWFVVSVNGKVISKLEMTKKPSGKSAAPVLFEFRGVTNEDGVDEDFSYQVYCKNNPPYYSAVEGARTYRKKGGKETTDSFRVIHDVRFGASEVRLRIKRHSSRKPTYNSIEDQGRQGPVPEWALMDIVPTLAFDKSRALEFNLLQTPHMSLRAGWSLVYRGVAGKSRLHVFALMRDGREQKRFLLDGRHRLVRVVHDNEVFDAVSKTRAVRQYGQTIIK